MQNKKEKKTILSFDFVAYYQDLYCIRVVLKGILDTLIKSVDTHTN